MLRAVYFDAWFPGEHCFHPSKPPRRRGMVRDLTEMRGTTLVWSSLGGGSIALPYLEQEAYEQVPARFRQHGFVNDSEFIALCREAGIDIFATVFEAQGWEVAARLADGEIAELNLVTDAARDTVGLREFSAGTGPRSWKGIGDYFPDGLLNSDGDAVTNLFEEGACRDLAGEPLHATWVEVPDNPSRAHYMDRNNPAWRQYLKAVIAIQIDAGATGIQLDESETPIGALRYGGCFCKDCMREMREYLIALPTEKRPKQLAGVDLASFDYRQWLLDQGCAPRIAPQTLPLYEFYIASQIRATNRTFAELAGFARAYAASRGKKIKVIGNFFDCIPYYDAMVDHVDFFVSEVRLTRYRQPWWYRHAVGFARHLQVIAVENPYGGVIPELNAQLARGLAYDRFRIATFEASAMGANMALPYGSWLGSEIRDSYWAPRELVRECGRFLEEIDPLLSAASANRAAILYSVASTMSATVNWDLFNDDGAFFELADEGPTPAVHYWDTIERLSGDGLTYDVVIAPDTDLRKNDLTSDRLARYEVLVVVSAWALAAEQHQEILRYLDAGGHVVLFGDYANALPGARDALVAHRNVTVAGSLDAIPSLMPRQIHLSDGADLGLNIQQTQSGEISVHLINYDYVESNDAVRRRQNLEVRVEHQASASAILYRPGQEPAELPVAASGGWSSFVIPELDTYAVVHLKEVASAAG